MKRWFGKLGIGTVALLIGVAALAGGAFSLATRGDSEATARDGGGGPPWMRGGDHPPTRRSRRWRKEKQQRRKDFESELGKESARARKRCTRRSGT